MKNEIGRKLTSLTIMAIMFAGGMAIGVPSFMPEAASDLSVTDGLLTVSTTTLQGAAVLEIVVNDPDNSDTTDNDLAPIVSLMSVEPNMTLTPSKQRKMVCFMLSIHHNPSTT